MAYSGTHGSYALPGWQARFVTAFRERGLVRYACEAAGVSKQHAYKVRAEDPSFRAAWDEAREDAIEVLEREARRRAVDGVQKPVYQGKELVGHVTEYSDVLLIFTLKAMRPEMYRDRVSAEISGPQGGPIRTEQVLSGMDDHERTLLRRTLDEAIAAKRAAEEPTA